MFFSLDDYVRELFLSRGRILTEREVYLISTAVKQMVSIQLWAGQGSQSTKELNLHLIQLAQRGELEGIILSLLSG